MMMKNVLKLTLIITLCSMAQVKDTCSLDDAQFLISFHPHLDAFWLDTDDDLKNVNWTPQGFLYAMNQRNSKTIFNSMLAALTEDKSRKYFITEIVFFKDWYDYLSDPNKQKVKTILANGQLEVANAGWVQNDQAVCYYDDILDQYTIGMDFLYSNFNITTKIGWATDSFGHSHSQVALQHLLGIEFQGIQRVDDRYIYRRKGKSLLEFYWSPVSDSNNKKYGGALTQVRHFLHEVNDFRHIGSGSIAGDFSTIKTTMSNLYGKNKLFRFLGNDFEEFITPQFQNLQNAMKTLNKDTQCKEFKYGNPTDYLNIVAEYWAANSLPTRQFDFMPNYDQDHYWTGYYTTDPQLKKICKDYSRLLNLYRKILAKTFLENPQQYDNHKLQLQKNMELLSVMQHHDGITATSKTRIEALFKGRMKTASEDVVSTIGSLKKIISQQTCKLYLQGNTCKINSHADQIYLSIVHEGVPKNEKMELHLPTNVYYDILNHEEEVFCNEQTQSCTLVFNAQLTSGKNVLILKKVEKSDKSLKVYTLQPFNNLIFKQTTFKVEVNKNDVTYSFYDKEFFKFSYTNAKSRIGTTDTTSWNKYGQKNDKYQNRPAGIYIMANQGKIQNIGTNFESLLVAKGIRYTKVFVKSQMLTLSLTIRNDELNVLDYETQFVPPARDLADYFLKVESSVVNPDHQFYQDMNGYLVSKRKIGYRPDYQWKYKPQDKINANTYPTCTFAYVIHQSKKFLVFLDRAVGLTTYDGALLINIDRLAGDDYKGVGEGYFAQVRNTFRFRFAIVSQNDDIQRQWQRKFDQAHIAYITTKPTNSQIAFSGNFEKSSLLYLKYNILVLNNEELLVRFNNLGEKDTVLLPPFSENVWTIPQLALNFKYVDIKESFANGIPLGERKSWINIPGEINVSSAASKDTKSNLSLAPLQIRSFRINLKQKIHTIPSASSSYDKFLPNLLKAPIQKVEAPKPFSRKRCF